MQYVSIKFIIMSFFLVTLYLQYKTATEKHVLHESNSNIYEEINL
jgi:hypothetical protein